MGDESDKKVYWLTGVAGTGKTTVAQSVAKMAEDLDYVVATFFFSRTAAGRHDYSSVIPTLAYQISQDTHLRSDIAKAAGSNRDIGRATLSIQVQTLLVNVLRRPSLRPNAPNDPKLGLRLLIILDAVDECNTDDNGNHAGNLLPILINALKDLPFVKLFLTSRWSDALEATFMDAGLDNVARTLALHRDIKETTTRSDIALYLKHRLAGLRARVPKSPLFPEEIDIHVLVDRAQTLFIYARTVADYISSSGQPDLRLKALLASGLDHGDGKYSRLDNLYSQILYDASKAISGQQTLQKLRSTLCTLVLLQEELPVDALSKMADVDEHQCYEFLLSISPLLRNHLPDHGPVRIMHTSFLEFISDPERCEKYPQYALDLALDHLRITERCLALMNYYLGFNLCGIEDASLFNDAIADLQDRMDKNVPIFLRYSCKFWFVHWLEHIRVAGPKCRVPQGLDSFCARHLLHWIEILSLSDSVHPVLPIMYQLNSVIAVGSR
jgi:hypothetical protein